ncbi:UvrD-helicase domain-containing protein [Jeotgalibaca caeni]|uniref:UvrD-helicase domain-containing protein n=1 Tax=Jeotgalibaca caeni TaxID=3028623 RepID=UPI003B83358C
MLCVTFTNKAAGDMKRRVAALLSSGYDNDLITTYHGFWVVGCGSMSTGSSTRANSSSWIRKTTSESTATSTLPSTSAISLVRK